MRNTISVLFFQRKNANRMEEMQSVMARITINGKSAEINTGGKHGQTDPVRTVQIDPFKTA